jgi:hypothetical protein
VISEGDSFKTTKTCIYLNIHICLFFFFF